MSKIEIVAIALSLAWLTFWGGWWLCRTRYKEPKNREQVLTYITVGYHVIEVQTSNGIKIGELIEGVDGYWAFFPETRGGYWEGWILQELANKLDLVNGPWDRQLRRFLRDSRPGYQPQTSLDEVARQRAGKGNPPPREP